MSLDRSPSLLLASLVLASAASAQLGPAHRSADQLGPAAVVAGAIVVENNNDDEDQTSVTVQVEVIQVGTKIVYRYKQGGRYLKQVPSNVKVPKNPTVLRSGNVTFDGSDGSVVSADSGLRGDTSAMDGHWDDSDFRSEGREGTGSNSYLVYFAKQSIPDPATLIIDTTDQRAGGFGAGAKKGESDV